MQLLKSYDTVSPVEVVTVPVEILYMRAAEQCCATARPWTREFAARGTQTHPHHIGVIRMSTVPTAVRSGSPAPAVGDALVSCSRFSWCVTAGPGHTSHLSAPVEVWHEQGCVVFAETDPDSGGLVYGPVLGTGESDESVGYGRVVAAELRAAAARVEALVARVELAGGAA